MTDTRLTDKEVGTAPNAPVAPPKRPTEAIVWTAHADGRFIEVQPSWQSFTGQSWDACSGVGYVSVVSAPP